MNWPLPHPRSEHEHAFPAPRGAGLTRLTDPTAQYLAEILAHVEEAVVAVDTRGVVVAWNPAAERLLGTGASAAYGRPLQFLDAGANEPTEEDAILPSQVAAQVLSKGQEKVTLLACAHPSRGAVTLRARAVPIRDPRGQALGVSFFVKERTEEDRIDEKLRLAARQRDEFLTTMSHELRTPLTSVLGYTDLLLRGVAGPVGPRIENYLANIRDGGHRLLDLVNALLDYARLEAGAEPVELEPLPLSPVLDRAVAAVRAEAEARSVHLESRAALNLPPVVADESKLGQILSHYVRNAIKFTPPEGTVVVEAERDPNDSGMVRIGVHDTGIGLSPDHAARVWERFFQADASLTRRYGGVGLGLAIVQHLAELQKGRVWVESGGPGCGSSFWLALPRAAAVGQPQPSSVPPTGSPRTTARERTA